MINNESTTQFKTLFFVRASLISLYLALTFPIPFIVSDNLKSTALLLLILGFILIFEISNDYLITNDKGMIYKASFISNKIGKKDWELFWDDIKLLKTFSTSQGSRIYYFINKEGAKFFIPQRLKNLEKLNSVIIDKTKFKKIDIKNISPIWTYKLLTFISLVMFISEITIFSFYRLSILNL